MYQLQLQLSVSSTAAWASLQIDRPRFLGRGLHLDFEVLQWSKLVGGKKSWYTKKNEQTATPNGTFALLLRTARTRPSQATAARELEARS